MQRLLVLALLAACWTGPIVDRDVKPPKPRAVRVKPQCWTTEFYEQWPKEVTDMDLLECNDDQLWDDVFVCRSMKLASAYSQLWYWTQRWFESCDPAKR